MEVQERVGKGDTAAFKTLCAAVEVVKEHNAVVRRAYDNQGAVGLCVGTFVVPERGFSRWLAVGFGKKKEVAL